MMPPHFGHGAFNSPKSPGIVSCSCSLAFFTMSRVIAAISFMNSSRRSLPRSICLSLNSQSPVSSGEMSSGMLSPRNSAMSENALAVGTSSRPARKRYFS